MDTHEEAQALPPPPVEATGAQAQGPAQQQQTARGAEVAATTHEADAEASDLDEWSLVDEQAEIIASVSTSSAHDPAPTAVLAEDQARQSAARTDEPDNGEHTHIQQDTAVHESGDRALTEESAPTSEEHVSSTTPPDAAAVPEGCLRIRLRVGEQTRPAWFKAAQIVDDFVAEFFTDAVAEGKKVRLIYMGMLLIRDRSMGEYGIEEDGVIHCVVTEAPSTPHHNANQQNLELKGFSNPANTLLILTGVGLYGLWTLLYHFPHLFSWKSIVLLSLFSAAHVSAMVSRFSSSFPALS